MKRLNGIYERNLGNVRCVRFVQSQRCVRFANPTHQPGPHDRSAELNAGAGFRVQGPPGSLIFGLSWCCADHPGLIGFYSAPVEWSRSLSGGVGPCRVESVPIG